MTDTTIALFNAPDLATSRVARAGRGLIKLSLGLKAIELSAAFILMAVICVSSAYAQAPSGTLFGGNDQQLSQGLRSFIYWLRNGLFCAGIVFIAWGSSTWRFVSNHPSGSLRVVPVRGPLAPSARWSTASVKVGQSSLTLSLTKAESAKGIRSALRGCLSRPLEREKPCDCVPFVPTSICQ